MIDRDTNLTEGTHPTRRAILDLLKRGELPAGEIARVLDVRRPALSHHLSALLEEQQVQCRPRGAFRYYSVLLPEKPGSDGATAATHTDVAEKSKTETSFTRAFKRLARERGIATSD